MDDSTFVSRGQRVCDHRTQSTNLIRRHCFAVEAIDKHVSPQILHHRKRYTIDHTNIKELDDIRMAQSGEGFRFALKPFRERFLMLADHGKYLNCNLSL